MANPAQPIVVDVELREERGKNACRRMRAAGRVPATVYGLGSEPLTVAVNPRRIGELLKLESGVNTILTLSAAGGAKQREVMMRQLQRDPITEALLHIDFVRVDLSKAITVEVPIHLVGVPTGVKNDGGILDFVHRSVTVECLPTRIPEHLDVDVTELHLNQHVSVSDLKPGEGVRITDDAQTIIAVVVTPRAEEEVAAPVAEAAAATTAEPEVIKKGKEATEEKAPEPKAKGKE